VAVEIAQIVQGFGLKWSEGSAGPGNTVQSLFSYLKKLQNLAMVLG
jgi:hypothetical protein